MEPYSVIKPLGKRNPILLSIPHSGTEIPEYLHSDMNDSLLPPDDTDFFVDTLYDFARDMGITILKANISRWVIDLNRDPIGTSLYNDGRIITGLCPRTDFNGNSIYGNDNYALNEAEISSRKATYFDPYHAKIKEVLNDLQYEFGSALLWDCHSIRRRVPGIQKAPFPDLILGTNDGKSVSQELANTAINELTKAGYELCINQPFKGGYITRSFGKPDKGQHAMQLEMSKDVYMDKAEINFDPSNASNIQVILKNTLSKLRDQITKH